MDVLVAFDLFFYFFLFYFYFYFFQVVSGLASLTRLAAEYSSLRYTPLLRGHGSAPLHSALRFASLCFFAATARNGRKMNPFATLFA